MSTLTFDVLWRDRGASKGMKSLGDQTEKTNKQFTAFGKIATVAAVAAGAALIKFGKDSVKAYSEAQQSQAKLQDAFARFPKLADTNIKALQGLNSELAKKTRFDDDATASGQAVLAQFQLTGHEITQLTPLLQDYAAKTGRDLPTAAKLLGKAVLGNGRALKEVGIDFKDTGDRGKNFEQIMGGLRTQVGGFAEKEGKTAAGQLEILKNQFGELQEEAGSKLLPTLTKIVSGTTSAVTAFGNLGPGVKAALTTFAVGVPSLILAAAGIAKVASAAKAAKVALAGMGIAAKSATIATAGIGAALGVAALAFAYYAEKNAKAEQTTDSFTEALIASNGAIDDNVRSLAIKALQDQKAFDNAEKLGLSLQDVTDAALGNDDAMRRVMAAVDQYAASVDSADTKTQDQVDAANELADALGPVRQQFDDGKRAAGQFGSATKDTSRWIYDAGQKSKDAAKQIDGLADSMFDASKQALALSGANIDYEQSVDDATRAAKTNGRTLDTNTQKGRDNKRALDNQVTSSQAYIRELIKTTGNSKKVERATKDAKDEFVRNAIKMGTSRDRAKQLADKYFDLDKRINGLNDKKITIKFGAGSYSIGGVKYSVNLTSPSSVGRRATGGMVRGAGSGTSDSIPMMLSNGEFVVNAKATARNRELLEALNGPKTKHPPATGMAAGGVVSHSPATGVGGASLVPGQANKFANSIATAIGKDIGGRVAKSIGATMGMGGPAGSAIASGGWASIYAILRRVGARRFTTYAGHDQGASRSRDITPPSNAIAETARRLSSIWYVIYNRRIASVTYGRRWRPYTRSNPHTDHVHVTLRPGVPADKGGMLASGGTASNMSGNLERVLSPAQTRDFHNLVKVISSSRGGSVGNTYIVNAPNYVGDKKDLVKALTDLDRQGRLAVVRR